MSHELTSLALDVKQGRFALKITEKKHELWQKIGSALTARAMSFHDEHKHSSFVIQNICSNFTACGKILIKQI